MKVIGITGQVGSGKSTIAKMMVEKMGVHLILTDEIAKDFMKPNGISYTKIIEHFGEEILTEEKTIDRNKLSKIVFNDKEKLEILNHDTHPYVMDRVKEEIDAVKKQKKASAILIETALLFEAGYETICDEIWYICITEEERRKRLKLSRGYTDSKIDTILSNQLKEEEFRKKCTKTIQNNGKIEEIIDDIQFMLVN